MSSCAVDTKGLSAEYKVRYRHFAKTAKRLYKIFQIIRREVTPRYQRPHERELKRSVRPRREQQERLVKKSPNSPSLNSVHFKHKHTVNIIYRLSTFHFFFFFFHAFSKQQRRNTSVYRRHFFRALSIAIGGNFELPAHGDQLPAPL